jgi:hypothetical protein
MHKYKNHFKINDEHAVLKNADVYLTLILSTLWVSNTCIMLHNLCTNNKKSFQNENNKKM